MPFFQRKSKTGPIDRARGHSGRKKGFFSRITQPSGTRRSAGIKNSNTDTTAQRTRAAKSSFGAKLTGFREHMLGSWKGGPREQAQNWRGMRARMHAKTGNNAANSLGTRRKKRFF